MTACGTVQEQAASSPVATTVTPKSAATLAPTSPQQSTHSPPVSDTPGLIAPSPRPAPSQTPTLKAPEGGIVEWLSEAEATSLRSLQQVDDFPLYIMHHYGEYPARAGSGAPPDDTGPSWACSLFATLAAGQEMLYGRNFDWGFSPALLLFAHPPDGYASVSMVDIAYLLDRSQVRTLMDLPLAERAPLLEAVYFPFDGMNDHGLTIGMAAVASSRMPHDPGRETIGSLGVIRELLDHARDVDEAVEIMGRYNLSMEGGPSIHYLIADRSGRAVLVEFDGGQMHVLPNKDPWHAATNHLRNQVEGDDDRGCWRYRAIQEQLAGSQGKLSSEEAMSLLQEVSQVGTQWSVVYGISSGEVQVSLGREYESVHRFEIAPTSP